HLRSKAETTARALSTELDVAVGADDRKLVERVVSESVDAQDLAYIEVRDATGVVLYRDRTPVDASPTTGAPRVAHDDGDVIRAWMPIELEGVALGTVTVGVDPARIDAIR